ncbi:MAG: CBS domain-containing protein, partial [Pseudomonadota bacterium]
MTQPADLSPPPKTAEGETDEEALAPDYALNPGFVRAVAEAAEARNIAEAKRLIANLHPADIADLLGLLRDEDRRILVDSLGEELSPDVLPELDEDVLESVVDAMRPEDLADAVAQLDTDDAVAVIEDLQAEKIAEILEGVPEQERLAVETALDYGEDCAGRLMQRQFFSAPAYWTVGQIIDHMRGAADLPDQFYEVFVVDPMFRPIGFAPLARVLKTQRDVKIGDIMQTQPRIIPATMDQEEVAYLFEQYKLISAPVVDGSERLVGMITVDDVVEVVHEETHEDMLALGGVREEGLSDNVVRTVRRRFSWLLVNLLTAVLASIVIAFFDQEIETLV